MRIIALITDAATIRDLLAHLGEPTAPPRIAPAPARPRAATQASAPARKSDDQRAKQPIAAENPRLTGTTDPTTLRLARLNCLSVPTTLAELAEALKRLVPDAAKVQVL